MRSSVEKQQQMQRICTLCRKSLCQGQGIPEWERHKAIIPHWLFVVFACCWEDWIWIPVGRRYKRTCVSTVLITQTSGSTLPDYTQTFDLLQSQCKFVEYFQIGGWFVSNSSPSLQKHHPNPFGSWSISWQWPPSQLHHLAPNTFLLQTPEHPLEFAIIVDHLAANSAGTRNAQVNDSCESGRISRVESTWPTRFGDWSQTLYRLRNLPNDAPLPIWMGSPFCHSEASRFSLGPPPPPSYPPSTSEMWRHQTPRVKTPPRKLAHYPLTSKGGEGVEKATGSKGFVRDRQYRQSLLETRDFKPRNDIFKDPVWPTRPPPHCVVRVNQFRGKTQIFLWECWWTLLCIFSWPCVFVAFFPSLAR